jgi:hypothetical protein
VSSSRCRRQPVVTRVERDDFVFFCHFDLLLFGLVAPKNADWQSGKFREVRISPTRKVDFEDFGVILREEMIPKFNFFDGGFSLTTKQ